MSIDFSDLFDDHAEAVLHPRDIFFTLDRRPEFSFPRDIQTEVMNRWFQERDRRDNVIKLNVGSGKTLVGLLLLQSSLNEQRGPALYVSPNKQLSQQVIQEAHSVGIQVTDDPRDPAYGAGERVCVVNVYKLFNGKSVFGVGASQIEIGTVIIDDAHACVSTISDQFRIRLASGHRAHNEIFTAVAEDLRSYSAARYLEIESGDPRVYMEVPFWSWAQHQSRILHVLHQDRSDDDLRFTYPLLRELLPHCRCVISGQYLEIEPHFPATDLIQSFRLAKRRIYMTATLSDDSVVVTHFGADPSELRNPIVPLSSQSMGERMILMPQELNPDLTIQDIRSLLVEFAEKINVVVIVPSTAAAEEWKNDAHQVLSGEHVKVGVERLRQGHVGLTVLINRYDGIDLPGDACRILAISDLPEVVSYSDLADSQVLGGTNLNLRRQIERIEQGMGRGVRSNDDYCTVLLLGAKLTRRLRSPNGQAKLTPATKVQLDLSRMLANRLGTPTLDQIRSVILQCLNRDSGWKKVSRKILLNLDSDEELQLDPASLAMRKAFDLARANQYAHAIAALDPAIGEAIDPQFKAWLLSRKATFQHAVDPSRAQKTLSAAHELEPGVTKPIHGAKFRKLNPASGQQASNLIENHKRRFIDLTNMKLFSNELCSDLQFEHTAPDKFEASVHDLAWFLGIQGHRPEKDCNEGPDNLWAFPDGTFLVIECKNGVTSDAGISKKDAGQFGQSVAWFTKRYPGMTCIPVMVHPSRNLTPPASVLHHMRVIDCQRLAKLRESIRQLAAQLAGSGDYPAVPVVAALLANSQLNVASFMTVFSVPAI